ncbi:MAG: hypothetical protein H2057_03850 [Alphaproteobacteria bacterium]|nr:hypothetical protein [Alphaproteobacteria bacterium]
MNETSHPEMSQEDSKTPDAPSVPKQLLSSFLCQKQWLFLGAAMVVVGSWPGWLPFFFPDATQKYLSGLLSPSFATVKTNDQALSHEITELRQEINAARAQAAAKAPDALEQKIDTLLKIMIHTTAWQGLVGHLERGSPYADELTLLLRVATPEQKADLDLLAPYAALGVPNETTLIKELARYLETERSNIQTSSSDTSENQITRFFKESWTSLKNLVKISKEGDPRFGETLSLDAALSLLRQGKLSESVTLITTSLEKQKITDLPPVLAAWLSHAKARLTVTPILSRLKSYMSSTKDLLSLMPTGAPHVA